jgi:hypothetical protein
MGKLVLRKTILRNMIDRLWAPLQFTFIIFSPMSVMCPVHFILRYVIILVTLMSLPLRNHREVSSFVIFAFVLLNSPASYRIDF